MEGEYRSAFESLFREENPRRATGGRGGYKGNVIDQGFGEDCGQSGEYILRKNMGVLDGENENSAEGFDVPLNISYNTLHMGLVLVLLDIVGSGQPRRVEDTNLVGDYTFSSHQNSGAYQYTIDAHNFVKVGQRNLANSTSFVRRAVENVKVVRIGVIAKKDIGNEFQE